MRPILVAGTTGQLARSLVDVGEQRAIPVVAVSRPELDLENADSIHRAVRTVSPLAIVNAAAYTAVDMAESGKITDSLSVTAILKVQILLLQGKL